MKTKRHLDIVIEGKVQGVFFRAAAQSKAHELGLVGFVQNYKNHVYIEIEGDDNSLEKFVAWCWQGSPAAKVASVKVKEGKITNLKQFVVK